jgi:hypothetical protein
LLKVILDAGRSGKATVAEKLEPGDKHRLIVASGLGTYILMAWTAEFTENVFRHSETCTLFMTGAGLRQFWEKMATVTETNWWQVPIDQAAFDHEPGFIEIVCVLLVPIHLARRCAPSWFVRSMLKVTLAIISSVIHGTVEVRKTVIAWVKGILSGWRWTSLLDSMVNWAQVLGFGELAELLTGVVGCLYFWVVQGDDAHATWKSLSTATVWILCYYLAGFGINVKKFFVTNEHRTEFLRMNVEPGVVIGYPGRSISSLFAPKPWEEDPVGAARIEEIVDRWMLILRRYRSSDLSWMLDDIVGASSLKREDVEELLHVPISMGGLGLQPLTTVGKAMAVREIPRGLHGVPVHAGIDHLAHAYGITGTALNDAARRAIGTVIQPPRDLRSDVEIRVYDVEFSRKGRGKGSGVGGWPLTLPVDPQLSSTWVGLFRQLAVEVGDVGFVISTAPKEWRSPARDLYDRASRGLWNGWVLGDLESAGVRSLEECPLAFGAWLQEASVGCLSREFSKARPRRGGYVAELVECEFEARDALIGTRARLVM